ncbi:serine kinase [Erythrobacteraceae bacterium CFH 75059]|uniref:HPr kinase/phosphorylase n=1 Tax=Qipengyuania thermophila TaxID=2509361 RepID=UPI001021AF83|nr:serine kinase [Qipengyuania thermophila]TCD02275.1 serine kinase [Erythrobacteraceae bacterium CFH 75059]
MTERRLLINASAALVGGRGILVRGAPGRGKTSLVLALVDRGATLVGDDGVVLVREGAVLRLEPPPRAAGLLEVRGVGLVPLPVAAGPLCLVLDLDGEALRLPEEPARCTLLDLSVPMLAFAAGDAVQAIRAEFALRQFGLPVEDEGADPPTRGAAAERSGRP